MLGYCRLLLLEFVRYLQQRSSLGTKGFVFVLFLFCWPLSSCYSWDAFEKAARGPVCPNPAGGLVVPCPFTSHLAAACEPLLPHNSFRTHKLSLTNLSTGFPGGSVAKNTAAKAGDTGSIPESGRSAGDGHGYPLQCSCLENPMDGGAWWAIVNRTAKESDTA